MRSATAKDFRTFYGSEPPKTWAGGVVLREGEIIFIAGVVWKAGHHPMAFFDSKGDTSVIAKHRSVLKWLEMLKWAGETVVYSHCNRQIKNAEKWLSRLGFEPVPDMQDIWKKEL